MDMDDDDPEKNSPQHHNTNLKKSPGWFRRASRIIIVVLVAVLPSFLHRNRNRNGNQYNAVTLQNGPKQPKTIDYLLGLRGVAALTVAIFHWSHGWYPGMNYAYGDRVIDADNPDVSSPQRSILQLPIIRLFYAAEASVAVFFIISGYVLALGPLRKLRRLHATQEPKPESDQPSERVLAFAKTLSSLAFRRFFRLYVPALASTAIAFVAQLFGLLGARQSGQPATLWGKVLGLAVYLRTILNVWDWDIRRPDEAWRLNPFLWTIPVEWRCSLALFLVMLMLFRARTTVRRITVCAIAAWALLEGHWEFCLFLVGYVLAERRVGREHADESGLEEEEDEPSLPRVTVAAAAAIKKTSPMVGHLRTLAKYTLLAMGLILLSYPPTPPSSIAVPIYGPLASLVEFKAEGRRIWHTFGSIAVLATLERTWIRRLFETSLARYLGRISYPLYLIHGPLIQIIGWRLRSAIANRTPETWSLNVEFAVATVAFFPILLWAADLFERAIERRGIEAARWVEQQLVSETG